MIFFTIFGLSIYTVALSVTHMEGYGFLVPYLQPFKEIIVLLTLSLNFLQLKKIPKLHVIDYIIILYFVGNIAYALLPIGEYGFTDRVLAVKSSSFFVLVYAVGRTFDFKNIQISKVYRYILLVGILAACVAVYEYVSKTNFQSLTGYADFNFYYFGQQSSGNYGLTWTFETETGLRRFASFFANPLEHSAATLVLLSCTLALYTNSKNKLELKDICIFALVASFVSIVLSLSRASFVSYFMMIYVYALITNNKLIYKVFHVLFILIVLYFTFLLTNEDVYDFVVETITFKNASSLGHVLEWVVGFDSMIQHPFGLGLGASGRVSIADGLNVGGENQFIIIGVQLGFLFFIVYILLQICLIYYPLKWFKKLSGRERKICLTLLLIKIGSIIPLFTSDFESCIYISYLSWFITGMFVDIISKYDYQYEA
ncbi:MAG: O-antigen ligase family protein [Pelobium sp.]